MPSLRNQTTPEDQRNVIIATVLVAIISFAWIFMMGPEPPAAPRDGAAATDTAATDTASVAAQPSASAPNAVPEAVPADSAARAEARETERAVDTAGRTRPPADAPALAGTQDGTARIIVVEHDLYTAHFDTRGATLRSFAFKEYTRFGSRAPVQLVDSPGRGALALAFTTPSSRLVDTRDFVFSTPFEGDTLRVAEGQAAALTFETAAGEGRLRQTYTFEAGTYDVGLKVDADNASRFMTPSGYEVIWDGGLPYTEGGTDVEQQATGAFAYMGGDVVSVLLTDEDTESTSPNGDVAWTAVKNKYFTAALMADDIEATQGVELVGEKLQRDGVEWKNLTARLLMADAGQRPDGDQFHLYLGPIDYYNLAKYDRDLYDMVDYGWDFFEWVTRPLAKYAFIPILTYLGGLVPYGVAVMLMALIVKTVVYPLTKSSYRSMAQMRELQPKMAELKEKYGDDPQKQQEEMMKMYRETGVNPLGGCLPMLLQYPVLIGLYMFIPQSIQLRQESFLWATDLSAPDKLLELPFSIPIYGDYVAGFTLLMGLAMLVQMRIQSPPDAGGQQKVFMYFMPAFIFFIFNQFASALSLYYLSYNIVSAAQQQWINMQIEQEKDKTDTPVAKRNGNGRNGSSSSNGSGGFLDRLRKKVEEAR